MGMTKYGTDTLLTIGIVCLVIIVAALFFFDHTTIKTAIIVLVVVFFGFTLNFFRDPHRNSPHDDNAILSPADGTVVLIKDVDEPEFLKVPAVQVSIFMSPMDVHVNRFPISGTVGFFRYIAGDYLVAMEEKSSERNERTHIGIENGHCRIMMKQIAGFIARRIVCDLHIGDRTVAGERFGMIKFGSRVDVIMPREIAVNVVLNQHVTAGETIIATVK